MGKHLKDKHAAQQYSRQGEQDAQNSRGWRVPDIYRKQAIAL